MTQEEKQLLLKDLCARLPYGINVHHRGSIEEISEISPEGEFKNRRYDAWFGIETCKPYLRPMSSMTEKEKSELNERFHNIGYFFTQEPPYDYGLMVQHADAGSIIISEFSEVYDWLLSHHFDYRGLIPIGLALEAPEDMYKTE